MAAGVGVVGYFDAPVAEVGSMVEPDRIADDFQRDSVPFVYC